MRPHSHERGRRESHRAIARSPCFIHCHPRGNHPLSLILRGLSLQKCTRAMQRLGSPHRRLLPVAKIIQKLVDERWLLQLTLYPAELGDSLCEGASNSLVLDFSNTQTILPFLLTSHSTIAAPHAVRWMCRRNTSLCIDATSTISLCMGWFDSPCCSSCSSTGA